MTLFADTRKALETHLDTLAPKPSIAWENVKFDPVEGVAYIAPFMLPAPSSTACLGGDQLNQGIFQIDIFVPLEKGTLALSTIADNIGALFNQETLTSGLAEVRVEAISNRFVGRDEAFYQGAVDVNYRIYS